MQSVETVGAVARTATAAPASDERVTVKGKFFFRGDEKIYVKGVTYGPFPVGADGTQFPPRHVAARDFALMGEAGINTVRVFTVPPVWLLDVAAEFGLKVLVGIPWSQHVTFLDDPQIQAQCRQMVLDGVRSCRRHRAIFAYLIGNEIPPDMVRWHGPKRVRRFLKDLTHSVKEYDPGCLVSYANFPSTEYLTIDFTDFLCFNVYLHDETSFRKYIGRLHNLAVDRPLVLTEFGVDSMREGLDGQKDILSWQIRTAFDAGVAGTFVFAWTDEWFTGGHLIEDWAFGIVDAKREKKPAFHVIAEQYLGQLPPPMKRVPRVSVVVCAYNADRTMDACLASLEKLNYPDYEVIVVNDGSKDKTLEISERYGYCRIISQENKGLSVARNVGAEAATGEIVAYTDSDCIADPDWLNYLVATMERKGLVACGGPNFPPPEDNLIPSVVAVSPGGPTHVLLTDDTAEHIAGCNMAFRRDVLLGLGGFDPVYRAAGDDVDICWRFQDAGYTIGYSPAAMVWHWRRNTIDAYIGQQKGYGKAEALVYSKHPLRFNLFGQAKWAGRIYGDLSATMLIGRHAFIYSGMFGRGLFQTLYEKPGSLLSYLPMTFEWNVVAILAAAWGLVAGDWMLLLTLPLLLTVVLSVVGALNAPIDARFRSVKARALVALLIYLGPLLRGKERIKWRLKEMQTLPLDDLAPPAQAVQVAYADRALLLSYWGENGEEKEAILGGLMRYLGGKKYLVVPDEGWEDWDLEVAGGIWTRARVTVCAENHGGMKRVLRVRCALRLSDLSTLALRCYAGATVVSLIAGAPVTATVIAAVGLAHLGYVGYRAVAFGTLLHRAVETVARQEQLTPVQPIAPTLPVGAPRPA